jgi:hypothetical protein
MAHRPRQPRRARSGAAVTHSATYPHGVNRLICTCGYDTGEVPGALALPDYDADWEDGPVAKLWRQHLMAVTFDALVATGWTAPDSEPLAGRDFDAEPGGHWSGCLCKWCTKAR